MSFSGANYWSQNIDAFSSKILCNQFFDLIIIVRNHFFSRVVTISISCSGIQQTQKIINFCNCTNSRARTFASGFLFDGNNGRKSINFIYIGTFQSTKELAGISRKSFHITTLSFGINRIESQRRFPRTRKSGNHHQFLPWNLDVYVF